MFDCVDYLSCYVCFPLLQGAEQAMNAPPPGYVCRKCDQPGSSIQSKVVVHLQAPEEGKHTSSYYSLLFINFRPAPLLLPLPLALPNRSFYQKLPIESTGWWCGWRRWARSFSLFVSSSLTSSHAHTQQALGTLPELNDKLLIPRRALCVNLICLSFVLQVYAIRFNARAHVNLAKVISPASFPIYTRTPKGKSLTLSAKHPQRALSHSHSHAQRKLTHT